MSDRTSLHSVCAWTFHAGRGGFTPAHVRPSWEADRFDTIAKIRLVKEKILPRLPEHVEIGFEMHYDFEFNEETAGEIADALLEAGISLALTTPGAHAHFGYGGIASLDPGERAAAQVAQRRKESTERASRGLGTWVEIDEDHDAMVDEARGLLPCPWPHGGYYPKRVTTFKVVASGRTFRWSDLNIHMIEDHGFFEGKGSAFRIEPAGLVRVLF